MRKRKQFEGDGKPDAPANGCRGQTSETTASLVANSAVAALRHAARLLRAAASRQETAASASSPEKAARTVSVQPASNEAPRQAASQVSPPARAASIDQQVEKLSEIVASAARHAERARLFHERAGVRVDSALYELDQLRRELAGVIPSSNFQRQPVSTFGVSGTRASQRTGEPQPAKVAPARSTRSAA